MASAVQSDVESNVSGFIRYNDKNIEKLYISMLQGMKSINQDILKVEKNMQNLVKEAGPLESQLSALLQSLPKPSIPMEID